MPAFRNYIKPDSDGSGNFALREFGQADMMVVAANVGTKWATLYDSTNEGNISITATATGQYDSIGHINDQNYKNDTNETDIDLVTEFNDITRFRMQNATYGLGSSGVSLNKDTSPNYRNQLPVMLRTDTATTTLQAEPFGTNDSTDAILDDIIVKIFTEDLPGTYYLVDSQELADTINATYQADLGKHVPDSDNWQILFTINELRRADDAVQTHYIFQKTSLNAGSASDNALPNVRNAHALYTQSTGTNLRAAGDSDLSLLLASALGRRLRENQEYGGVGKLVISLSNPGADYRQLGTGFADQISGIGDVTVQVGGQFTGPTQQFPGSRTLGFPRFYSNAERDYFLVGVRSGVFSGTRQFGGQRDVTFQAIGAGSDTGVGTYKLYVKIA
jgi:hypothetical protein